MEARWCALLLLLGCSGDPAPSVDTSPDAGVALDDAGSLPIDDLGQPSLTDTGPRVVEAPARDAAALDAGVRDTMARDVAARDVAAWIVDAAERIAPVAALRARDPATYEACLVRIARHTMSQSSRIFPLEGQIDEGQVFPFLMGVTYGVGSRTGFCGTCYCRINSLTRGEWCRYLAGTTSVGQAGCLASYGGTSGWNDAWAAHCLENHSASWDASFNPHYRAQAWIANRALRSIFPDPATASGAAVLRALEDS